MFDNRLEPLRGDFSVPSENQMLVFIIKKYLLQVCSFKHIVHASEKCNIKIEKSIYLGI